MKCRHCNSSVSLELIDFGFAPPSNAYLTEDDLNNSELYLPLRVKVCEKCWLVQTEDFAERDMLFTSNYAYFSSTSKSWVKHARDYFEKITQELSLGPESFVVELASNDGYLLKNFVEAGIPCLGVEPTQETALRAESEGVRTIQEFFGTALSNELKTSYPRADLIIGNNVYAHVPDINDFTLGIKTLLAPGGIVTLEFPHLLRLISECQFDTIYHEHYSYLSLKTVIRIFDLAGLRVFRVEKLSTHGGSLRVFGCHADDSRETEESISQMLQEEEAFNLEARETYEDFERRAIDVRNRFVEFLIEKQRLGQLVVGYGAAAKGNTLLNFSGIKKDLLPIVFDAASSKQNMFLPGTRIPVKDPKHLRKLKPSVIIIFPWNLAAEITGVLSEAGANESEVWVALPKMVQLNKESQDGSE